RLYGWSPATLSIGFNQGDVLTSGLPVERVRVPVVRRMTGGRAIFHDRELTYSIVCAEDDPIFGGSVWETYLKISACLVDALRSIGIDAAVAGAKGRDPSAYGSPREGSPSCFSTPSPHEIAVGEAKIAASAQRRARGTLLQHGSILVDFDPARLAEVLGLDLEGEGRAEYLRARVGWIGRYRAERWTAQALGARLLDAIGARTGIHWFFADLNAEEIALAHHLKDRKYSRATWTLKRLEPGRERAERG
ncbi:MAG: lipoate--protein ligase family protein, partial [Myxococcales bacterium]|nr:lipoate--protein ligase family protein [Myxococcales bacterium]